MELLDRLSRGESVASVGRYYGVNESTVPYIKKNEKAIRESVVARAVPSTKVVTQFRDVHINVMEKALNVWVEDNAQKNVPLSGPLIREMAKRMYDNLTGMGGAASMSDVGTSYAGMSDVGTSEVGTSGHSPFQASRE